ncbi:leucine-rich repeat flightless-interacting protein 1 isoform X5 [Calypte anna]|uniref:leucine-rich repeat flightless-interacting protein 1 isoform X5 n=1 Tax=Calypte anna TaxID=9244 RepID=UPI0011C45E5E|nr:leucine-rich repeat flightless-interacting protein 1 isoform X5 [Calypte anna]
MGTQGAGRKRLPNRERLTAEDDALNQIAREAEARLAAKRAARAEAREIRMKELERQQKEIYQVQKRYYGLDTKWGDIEQWMEDSELYSRRARRNASALDEDEHTSIGSRGSLRSHLQNANTYPVASGYEEDLYGSSQSRKSSRASYYSDLGLHNSGYASTSQPSSQNGNWPSEYSSYLGSGSRASSRASSSRASPVIEERPEKDFEKGARSISSLSAATLASLGGTSSRRGSGDTSISADTEASIREIKDIYELKDQIQDVEGKYMQGLKEIKDSLAEVEEKYKKAMVSNAQLDNEKTNFMYQVDTLKDALLELEEQLAESRRQYEEKSKEFEREKHAHSILQFQYMEIKEALKQREEMLAKHGIIPDSGIATNGETSDILSNEGHTDPSKNVPGTTWTLETGRDGMLGKANEVDMKNEILEDVGKREILQNTEHEEHREETEEQEVQTLHADENAKAEKLVEEHDALSTMVLPDSRFKKHFQSLKEDVSGSSSSNDDSDTENLRKENTSTGPAVQQPVGMEAEQQNLNPKTNQNSEMGSLQGNQIFDTGVLDTKHELEKAAPKQEEQEDLKTSQVLSDNEMGQEGNVTNGSFKLVSDQAGLLEDTVSGLLSEEVNVESQAEALQHSEASAGNKETNVSHENLAVSKDCTDGRTDKAGGEGAEENESGNIAESQKRAMESVGLEGVESSGSGVPAGASEKEDEDQAGIQPVSSEDSPSASSEEQNNQVKTELENASAEKDRQKEIAVEELEMCSDSAGTAEQDEAPLEAGGCITEMKGNVLHQAEPDTDTVKQVTTQETRLDPSLLANKICESELGMGDESGEQKESRTEWMEDLQSKVEVQTVQCSEEMTYDRVGEINIPLESEEENVIKPEEGKSKEESTVDVTVTTENKVGKETLKENEQKSESADHHCGGFVSQEGANSSLVQKAEQEEGTSEQVKLESQAEERLDDDGDAFDFDEESKQLLETDEKCDGPKAGIEKEEGDGANGAVRKTAQTDKALERTDKTEIKDAFTEDNSLQHEGDKPEETQCLQGEVSWKTEENNTMEYEIKTSDSSKVHKIPDEYVLKQDLESAGNSRDETQEDCQGGRRGKGKSRDDCTVS